MAAQAGREIVHLAHDIAAVQPGEARRVSAVPLALQAVTVDARPLRPRIAAAEREQLAGLLETIGTRFALRSGRKGEGRGHGDEAAFQMWHV